MAKVLYGVMGNTHGHVARTLAIVSRLPEHEFYFVGGGRVPEMLGRKFPVLEVPVKRTIHKNQRVSIPATLSHILRCIGKRPSINRQIGELIHRWKPDIAICDREFFVPRAARAAGLECVSLDHSHVLSACRYPVPAGQRVSWALARLEDALFFNVTKCNLIISFFHPELKADNHGNELLPPVLRPEIQKVPRVEGEHVVLYQTSPTFTALLHAARQLSRRVIVYGFRDAHAVEGNLVFKPFHPVSILEDLAGCAYAVVNGGHNLICEALALGKPVLCFPITGQFEQFINAWHVRELGYGDFSTSRVPEPHLFADFETHLEKFRRTIREKFVDGTEIVIEGVRKLLREKTA